MTFKNLISKLHTIVIDIKSATIHSLRGGEFGESAEVGEDRRRSTGGPIFSEMVEDRAMKFGKA